MKAADPCSAMSQVCFFFFSFFSNSTTTPNDNTSTHPASQQASQPAASVAMAPAGSPRGPLVYLHSSCLLNLRCPIHPAPASLSEEGRSETPRCLTLHKLTEVPLPSTSLPSSILHLQSPPGQENTHWVVKETFWGSDGKVRSGWPTVRFAGFFFVLFFEAEIITLLLLKRRSGGLLLSCNKKCSSPIKTE